MTPAIRLTPSSISRALTDHPNAEATGVAAKVKSKVKNKIP
jgi:hypothetical protein